MPKISKNIFLNSIVCPKLGWLMRRRQVTHGPTLGEKFRNEEGSVIVYSTFEKTMINKLKELFPDLSQELDLIIERLVDLHKIIRDNYYHPDFHGSTSIKKVLPILVPEMSYDLSLIHI